MQAVLSLIQDLPPTLVYLVSGAVVAAETAMLVGMLLPGEATLLLVGFLAYTGTLRLAPALAVMIVAALAGDTLAFHSGRRYGPRLRAGRWGTRIGEARWRRADDMLGRLGGRALGAARWVAFARTLVPRLAGAAGLPYRRFAPWNALGVSTWVGTSVLIGYLAGESYATATEHLGRATAAVLVLAGCVVAIVAVGRWLGRNPDPARALLARAAALPPLRWALGRYGVLFFLLSMHIGPAWALLANLGVGLLLLLVIGLALAWLVGALVRHSGLAVVDELIADWMAAHRTDGMAEVASAVIGVLRGSVLILVVALVAVGLGWRARAWRDDLISVLGTIGASVPLVVLALVTDLSQRGPSADAERAPAMVFSTQNTVATASLCTLAWLLARRARWPRAVAAWTGAAVGVVAVGGARLYVGWSSASETLTSVLLGGLWTAVFMVAWVTRDRAAGDHPLATGTGAPAGQLPGQPRRGTQPGAGWPRPSGG